MLSEHLEIQIIDNLDFEPTIGQRSAILHFAEFILSQEPDIVFLLKGYAGTGKTSMLKAVVKVLEQLKFRIFLLAPTGRAAKVLSAYTGKPAYTIHKKIYRQQSSPDGMGRFVLDRNLLKNSFFIVDEASMVANESTEGSVFGSGRLLDDLYSYVYSCFGCRLILVGDTAQLPPVGLAVSPALRREELEMYGLMVIESELTEVVRQQQNSGILLNATMLRQMISSASTLSYFSFQMKGFDDLVRLNGGDLIEKLSECYDLYGEQETIVVCRSNKRANKFNQGIRSSILYKDSEITTGDLLMIVKNNYFWNIDDERADFIANGDIVRISSIRRYEEMYGFRFADVSLQFIDYDDIEVDCKIFLDTLSIETASMNREDAIRLFHAIEEDYQDIRNKKKRWEKIRENPYFNALQVKFAYAVTCHKAQGGQWDAVFIDQGYVTEEMIDREYQRWLYTAFTRPVKELYLVNFNKEFFGEK